MNALMFLLAVGPHSDGVPSSAQEVLRKPWDWNVVIGTGQSLATGAFPVITKSQPFHNLKMGSGDLEWPISSEDPKLVLEPLVEPVGREPKGYPNSWPRNIGGETPHSTTGNQISALVAEQMKRDYITVHYDVAEAGQGMIRIRKNSVPEGMAGRAYEASMIQTRAIARLAKEQRKSFGVAAILMTHGETDTGNGKYEEELRQLWSDYNTDIKAITKQGRNVLMIVSQHNRLGEFSPSTQAQWKVGKDDPNAFVCSGPKYQYPYGPDGLHLTAEGYRMLGEKYGQVYFERVVRGNRWRPVEPDRVSVRGDEITVKLHVPKKPLVWDSVLGDPHPSFPEWAKGRGFELTGPDGKRLTILSAELRGGDSVVLKLDAAPPKGARLSYAMVGEPTQSRPPYNASPHWGQLRDSDPFVGYATGKPQPNYCVAFIWPLP